jgi:hypothetical protein
MNLYCNCTAKGSTSVLPFYIIVVVHDVRNYRPKHVANVVNKWIYNSLMFIPCISDLIEEKTNNMHWLYLTLFIFTCWLLHVSAEACHHQGAYWILLSYLKTQTEVCVVVPTAVGTHNTRNHDNPAQNPRNHTLYDIPTLSLCFQVT